jgi:hypothetical protein
MRHATMATLSPPPLRSAAAPMPKKIETGRSKAKRSNTTHHMTKM